MHDHDETFEALLANRAYQYRLLQAAFAAEPTDALLDQLLAATAQDSLLICLDDEARRSLETAFAVQRAAREADRQGYLGRARDEYTRLFLGPGKPACPPWESLAEGGEGTLFGAATLEVRRAYAKAGFRPAQWPHVADDHLALELSFMAELAQRWADAIDGQEAPPQQKRDDREPRAQDLPGFQRSFLRDHLLAWVPALARDVAAADRCGLYALMAEVCARVLAGDAQLLGELAAS